MDEQSHSKDYAKAKITGLPGKLTDYFMNLLPLAIRRHVPNILTSIRVASSIGIVASILTLGVFSPIGLALWTAVTAATDFVDGYVARRYHIESELGSFLDAAADKVLNWGVGLSLIATGAMPLWPLFILGRDIPVAVMTGIHKYKTGVSKKKDAKQKKDFVSQWKDFQKGESIPPTMLAKAKMWLQSFGTIFTITSGCSFSGWGLLGSISMLGAIGLAGADLVVSTKRASKRHQQVVKKEERKAPDVSVAIPDEQASSLSSSLVKAPEKRLTVYPEQVIQAVERLAMPQPDESQEKRNKVYRR